MPRAITKGIITVFDTTVGIKDRYLCFLKSVAKREPINVASVPNIMSRILPEKKKLNIRQPTVTPGTAQKLIAGRTHRASDILI